MCCTGDEDSKDKHTIDTKAITVVMNVYIVFGPMVNGFAHGLVLNTNSLL